MKHLRSFALAAFAGCLSLALAPSVHADQWDKKTNITVNEPVQLPSCCTPDHTVTLQPGEYVLMIVDSLSDRHIVRVFDKDQQHVITTILAIPNHRLRPTGETVLQYWEVPAGQPRALRAWFYPGDNFGQEFAYPKQTAAQIAAYVKTPVPAIAIDTTVAEELKAAPLLVVDESGKASELAQVTPPPAPQPTVETQPAQPQELALALERPSPMPMAPTKQELPDTASGMPLVGLIGFLSMGAAALLRIRFRRGRN